MTAQALATSRFESIRSGVAVGLRLAIGGLFLYAAKHKVEAPGEFLEVVYGYELVGPKMGFWVATMLPAFELILGACLIAGVMKAGSALMATAIVAVFLMAQVSAMARGLSIDCGCFGLDAGSTIGAMTLVQTGFILAGAATLLVLTLLRPGKTEFLRFSSTMTDDIDRLSLSGRPI